MKAGLYARVSTDDQQSQNQLIELREFAKRRGIESEEFIDIGLSGKLGEDKRPELKRLMQAARLRKVDIVICWDLTRFARSMKQLVDSVENLRLWNVGFTTLRENIDTTTANGRLVFHIFSALAEFERELIVERTKLGLRRAVAQGKTLGRPKVKIISKSGDTAQEILGSLAGLSLRAAATWLSERGHRISKTTLARWRKGVPQTGQDSSPIIVGSEVEK